MNSITPPSQYRADIDGLRAIAVLLVLFYHSGFKFFGGGYIGVDVFFVISGYLISSILIKDIESGTFSLINFYERRIRRIIPALYGVILFVICASLLFFLPKELSKVSESVITTIFFVSNFFFWQDTGYFDGTADIKPLLHTWSLSVEEQFYIFFPIIVVFLLGIFSKYKNYLLILAFCLSLGLSIWASENAMTANFYLVVTRAWELMIGAMIALMNIRTNLKPITANILSIIALAGIIASGILYSYQTPFPGLYALIPCLGTGILIAIGRNNQTCISKMLSLKPLVFIGLLSYSLYLWHWPIIVFAKYIFDYSVFNITVMLALSFVLAYLSWLIIEQPIRKKTFLKTRKELFIGFFISTLILLSIAAFINKQAGLPERFKNIAALEEIKARNFDQKCADIPANNFNEKKCIFSTDIQSNSLKYVIWGDSHALAMAPAIIDAAKEYNISGFLSANSGCPPLIDTQLYNKSENQKCVAANTATFDNIGHDVTVFLVARWGYYLDRSPITKEGPAWLKDKTSTKRGVNENYHSLEHGLVKTIKALKDKKNRIILIDTVPEFPKDPAIMMWQFNQATTLPIEDYANWHRPVTNLLQRISNQTDIKFIEPSNIFCDENECTASTATETYFRDNDHISRAGAKKLVPLYKEFFKTQSLSGKFPEHR